MSDAATAPAAPLTPALDDVIDPDEEAGSVASDVACPRWEPLTLVDRLHIGLDIVRGEAPRLLCALALLWLAIERAYLSYVADRYPDPVDPVDSDECARDLLHPSLHGLPHASGPHRRGPAPA